MLPERAIEIIKHYEGWHRKLPDGRAAPYVCPAGVLTIGYGATFLADGSPVTAQTPPITLDEGEALLNRQLAMFENGVIGLVRPTVPLNANMRGALTSFAFNLGLGRLKSSTLLRRVNEGRFEEAANEFPKWVMAGGRKLDGLVRRRASERSLFLAPVQAEPPSGSAGSREADQLPQTSGWIGRFVAGFRQGQSGQLGTTPGAG